MGLSVPLWMGPALVNQDGMEWTALSTAPVAAGVWAVTSRVCVLMVEPVTPLTATVHVPRAGEGSAVRSAARMVRMVWTVKSAVTAVMLMDVTTPQDTAAAWPDGPVFTVTVCVLRDTGARTALSPVTVRTGRPALRTRAPVSVLLDTEAPPVRGSALLGTSGTAVVRPVHSVFTVMGRVTMSLDNVTVCLVLKGHCAMRCAPVDALGRTVLGAVAVQTMALVTPSMGHASVTQAGSAATVHNLVLLVNGAPTAFTLVTVTMEPTAVPMTESVNAHQDGPAFTAHNVVLWVFMGRTVLRLVSAGTGLTVTTFRDNAPVALASWDSTVSRNALQVLMGMVVVMCATV